MQDKEHVAFKVWSRSQRGVEPFKILSASLTETQLLSRIIQ